jgi:SAM-dependent methyltransferase
LPGDQYKQIRASLRASYGEAGARLRDQQSKAPWKVAERAAFLRPLRQENCRTLLEIGAGTGQDSLFFAAHGLDVVATDLPPAMVARCREKGLNARVLDFSQPAVPARSFDAVLAMNCLLHVPNAELPAVLATIRQVLRPGGLLFVGVYGGSGEEGLLGADDHVPPRFFSWRTDDQIQAYASEHFEIVDFHTVPRPRGDGFQSLTLRRPRAYGQESRVPAPFRS